MLQFYNVPIEHKEVGFTDLSTAKNVTLFNEPMSMGFMLSDTPGIKTPNERSLIINGETTK